MLAFVTVYSAGMVWRSHRVTVLWLQAVGVFGGLGLCDLPGCVGLAFGGFLGLDGV